MPPHTSSGMAGQECNGYQERQLTPFSLFYSDIRQEATAGMKRKRQPSIPTSIANTHLGPVESFERHQLELGMPTSFQDTTGYTTHGKGKRIALQQMQTTQPFTFDLAATNMESNLIFPPFDSNVYNQYPRDTTQWENTTMPGAVPLLTSSSSLSASSGYGSGQFSYPHGISPTSSDRNSFDASVDQSLWSAGQSDPFLRTSGLPNMSESHLPAHQPEALYSYHNEVPNDSSFDTEYHVSHCTVPSKPCRRSDCPPEKVIKCSPQGSSPHANTCIDDNCPPDTVEYCQDALCSVPCDGDCLDSEPCYDEHGNDQHKSSFLPSTSYSHFGHSYPNFALLATIQHSHSHEHLSGFQQSFVRPQRSVPKPHRPQPGEIQQARRGSHHEYQSYLGKNSGLRQPAQHVQTCPGCIDPRRLCIHDHHQPSFPSDHLPDLTRSLSESTNSDTPVNHGSQLQCKWRNNGTGHGPEAICGFNCNDESGLNDHIKLVHTPYVWKEADNRVACRWVGCDSSFKTKPKLDRHMLTHSGFKEYRCSYVDPVTKKRCPKLMATQDAINKHARTHTGERPHQCSHCDSRFATSTERHTHEITHTGEKPHICPICRRGFADSSNLSKHKKKHAVPMFYCEHPGCNAKMRRWDQMSRHFENVKHMPELVMPSHLKGLQDSAELEEVNVRIKRYKTKYQKRFNALSPEERNIPLNPQQEAKRQERIAARARGEQPGPGLDEDDADDDDDDDGEEEE